MIGTKLGSYEIIEELGKGGMATVYRAYQPHMERYVAVKVIRRAIVDEATTRERFQREARIIARLEHPHLLPIYDFDGTYDPPYIVMRYLEGGTLKEALTGRRLPFGEITYLLRQIGSALDYAHRQGVIHRDIKPSNIMIDQEGNAFVMDFGIARMTGRDGAEGGRVGGDLTGTGTIIGTPDYMAPEQGYGTAEIEPQADVYSLGVMLFEMTTGQLPYKGQSPMETMLHHLTKPVPSAHELNPEVPPELDEIFLKAMAKEPAERYDSVIDFVAAVVDALGGTVATTPEALQEAAVESLALVDARRDEIGDQIEATMAEFAQERGGAMPRTDSQATPSKQHRTVTALYADVAEYSEMVDLDLGSEAARRAVQDLWSHTARIVDEHGGAIFNRSDRDLLALWGSVSAREDDPERAVRASLAVRDNLGSLVGNLVSEDEPLPIRVGINTGHALIAMDEETGSYTASGATVSLASRVADNADGLVLITQDTYRHVQGIFDIQEDLPLRVRRAGGRAQVSTFRVNTAKPRAFRLQPRGVEGIDTRMVGRRAELEQLQKAYFNAIEDSETQMVTVVAAAGLGKSRLLYEFASWAELRPERYYIFRGRATPAMTSRPYGLWRDVLSFRFEILDSDSPETVREKMVAGITKLVGQDDKMAHLMGHLAGFDFSGSPYLAGDPLDVAEKSRKAVLQFFQTLTDLDPEVGPQVGSVVIQLEDLHHADDASLDLLAEMTSADENLPLMVVAMARPGLYQRRPTWGSGQESHLRIDLRALDKRDSRDLAVEILQKVENLPRELRDLIVERAEGNPYYMEELVKMLLEDRVIQKLDQDRWSVETSRLKHLRVPPTLVGLLQARFDSLLYPEKLTLQRAAVVGRVFYDSAVVALDSADETQVDDLRAILKRLTKREFIFPRETSAFEGSTEYIFGQAMMRSLILGTLLERQTMVYHRTTAEWFATHSGERAAEYDGQIAEHYELAGEFFLAAQHLAKASGAALDLGAYQDGIRTMERGLSLLTKVEDSPDVIRQQMNMQMRLAHPLGFLGEYDKTQPLLESALDAARELEDRQAEANALAQLGRLVGVWQEDFEGGRAYLEQALEINKELDDKKGLVFILRQLGNAAHNTYDFDGSIDYLEQSLALARELGDQSNTANALNSLGNGATGLGDNESALKYYQEALDISRQLDDTVFEAMMIGNMAHVYTDMEDYHRAQEMAEEVVATANEVNSLYLMIGATEVLARAGIGLGQDETARDYLDKSTQIALELDTEHGKATNIALYVWLSVRAGDAETSLPWLYPSIALLKPLPWFQRLTKKIYADLPADMTEAEIEAAVSRGENLTVDEVIEQILPAES